MTAKGRKDENPAEPTSCDCGAGVMAVQVSGVTVHIDRDRDPDGDVAAVKLGGRWTYTAAAQTAGAAFRYRRHRCPRTAQADLRRTADSGDRAGPCVGYCGVTVPRRYGDHPEPMCPACKEKRAARTGGAS